VWGGPPLSASARLRDHIFGRVHPIDVPPFVPGPTKRRDVELLKTKRRDVDRMVRPKLPSRLFVFRSSTSRLFFWSAAQDRYVPPFCCTAGHPIDVPPFWLVGSPGQIRPAFFDRTASATPGIPSTSRLFGLVDNPGQIRPAILSQGRASHRRPAFSKPPGDVPPFCLQELDVPPFCRVGLKWP